MTTLKATAHSGHGNLGRHLMKTDENELVEITAFGVSDDAITGVAELHALSQALSRRGTRRTLLHVSINPRHELGEEGWCHAWELYEEEFGLVGRAYVQARHVKRRANGTKVTHCHRVYSTVDPAKRTVVNLDDMYARHEAVARAIEYDRYGPQVPMTKGRHNRHAALILQRRGRDDVVQAMLAQGLCDGAPGFASAKAGLSKDEVEQQERTGVNVPKLAAQVCALYQRFADRPIDFLAALYGAGHAVKRGDRGWSLIDKAGAVHGLGRLINRAAKQQGLPLRLRQADVDRFFAGVDVEPLARSQSPERERQRDEAKQVIGAATDIAFAGCQHPSPVTSEAVGAVMRFVETQPTHATSQQLRRALSAVAAAPIGAVLMLASWALHKLRKWRPVTLAPRATPVEVVEEYASDDAPQPIEPGALPVLAEDSYQVTAEEDGSDLEPDAARDSDPVPDDLAPR